MVARVGYALWFTLLLWLSVTVSHWEVIIGY